MHHSPHPPHSLAIEKPSPHKHSLHTHPSHPPSAHKNTNASHIPLRTQPSSLNPKDFHFKQKQKGKEKEKEKEVYGRRDKIEHSQRTDSTDRTHRNTQKTLNPDKTDKSARTESGKSKPTSPPREQKPSQLLQSHQSRAAQVKQFSIPKSDSAFNTADFRPQSKRDIENDQVHPFVKNHELQASRKDEGNVIFNKKLMDSFLQRNMEYEKVLTERSHMMKIIQDMKIELTGMKELKQTVNIKDNVISHLKNDLHHAQDESSVLKKKLTNKTKQLNMLTKNNQPIFDSDNDETNGLNDINEDNETEEKETLNSKINKIRISDKKVTLGSIDITDNKSLQQSKANLMKLQSEELMEAPRKEKTREIENEKMKVLIEQLKTLTEGKREPLPMRLLHSKVKKPYEITESASNSGQKDSIKSKAKGSQLEDLSSHNLNTQSTHRHPEFPHNPPNTQTQKKYKFTSTTSSTKKPTTIFSCSDETHPHTHKKPENRTDKLAKLDKLEKAERGTSHDSNLLSYTDHLNIQNNTTQKYGHNEIYSQRDMERDEKGQTSASVLQLRQPLNPAISTQRGNEQTRVSVKSHRKELRIYPQTTKAANKKSFNLPHPLPHSEIGYKPNKHNVELTLRKCQKALGANKSKHGHGVHAPYAPPASASLEKKTRARKNYQSIPSQAGNKDSNILKLSRNEISRSSNPVSGANPEKGLFYEELNALKIKMKTVLHNNKNDNRTLIKKIYELTEENNLLKKIEGRKSIPTEFIFNFNS